jgi:protein TonB
MTNSTFPEPQGGFQAGEAVQSSALSQSLPGPNPLFQLSWLREIFHNRNQEYGAYRLRQQYSRNMMWGGLLAIFCAGLLCGGSLLARVFHAEREDWREYTLPPLADVPVDKTVTPPPPPPVAPPPPPARPTIAFVVPKAIRDDLVAEEHEPPTQEEMADKTPSTLTQLGDPNGVDVLDEAPIDVALPAVIAEEETKETPKETIFHFVEQMPAFRGDLTKYLAAEIRYPDLARDNGIAGIVVIQFVLNEKGEINHPFVLKDIGGGCGEEALRVVRAMPPWLPGAQRGRPVKVQMNLPVKFVLK